MYEPQLGLELRGIHLAADAVATARQGDGVTDTVTRKEGGIGTWTSFLSHLWFWFSTCLLTVYERNFATLSNGAMTFGIGPTVEVCHAVKITDCQNLFNSIFSISHCISTERYLKGLPLSDQEFKFIRPSRDRLYSQWQNMLPQHLDSRYWVHYW